MGSATSPRDDAPHPTSDGRDTAAEPESPERPRGEAAATLTRPTDPTHRGEGMEVR